MKHVVGLNPFFLEQWEKGGFLAVNPVGLEELQILVTRAARKAKPGYREGVILAPLPEGMFRSKILTLTPGQEAKVFFKSRVEGEAPRLTLPSVEVQDESYLPAGCTWAVLYAHHVLAEKDEARTGHDWDLITLLTNPTWEDVPMNPQTLMANHFGFDGGSNTNMTPETFEAKLRESVMYWSNKAMAYVEKPNA